jgi:hypothetical protein
VLQRRACFTATARTVEDHATGASERAVEARVNDSGAIGHVNGRTGGAWLNIGRLTVKESQLYRFLQVFYTVFYTHIVRLFAIF